MTIKTNVTVNPSEIQTPRYQRNLDVRRVEKIASEFNAAALGAITIVKRPDGTLWIIDGNHRRNAAIRVGHMEMFAIQYEGLTLAEEAALFLELNSTKQVQAVDRFHASVLAGDKQSVQIAEVLAGHGWTVSMDNRPGKIASVSALGNIYQGLGIAGRKPGVDLVDEAMAIVTGAWGSNRDGGQGQIIRGIAKVLARYEGQIERGSLIERLSKITPATLIAESKATASAIGCISDVGVARRVVQHYNARKRTGQIAEWNWSR
jgi:hypothetical protein